MKKYILLLIVPFLSFGQTNYTINNNTNPSDGNIFLKTVGQGGNKPVMILDKSGEVLFSENMGMKGWAWTVNENNHLTYFDRNSFGWFVMDSLNNVVDSVYAQNGYTADNHDFLALPNGNYILFCYDMQPYPMDSIVPGGSPNAMVEGLVIQELDSNHNVIFQWESWDHFNVTDNTYLDLTSDIIAFIHTNAIDIDYDENLLISSRNIDEITKIDRTSGEIIWRWGGSQNEFEFVNDYPFTHQHCIKSLGNNRYLLFDNGNFSSQYTGEPNVSRAVEYELDLEEMTATKVWEFIHTDLLFSPSISSVQRLENGNTLINFGNLSLINRGAVITEVNQKNEIVFELEIEPPGDNGSSNVYCTNKFDWFFASSIIGCGDDLSCNYNQSAIIIDNDICAFPGDPCETENITGIYNDFCECVDKNSTINEIVIEKNLTKKIDVLGKESNTNKGFQLHIYNDGSVEKKYVIE